MILTRPSQQGIPLSQGLHNRLHQRQQIVKQFTTLEGSAARGCWRDPQGIVEYPDVAANTQKIRIARQEKPAAVISQVGITRRHGRVGDFRRGLFQFIVGIGASAGDIHSRNRNT